MKNKQKQYRCYFALRKFLVIGLIHIVSIANIGYEHDLFLYDGFPQLICIAVCLCAIFSLRQQVKSQ
jgi:hypothetical protein